MPETLTTTPNWEQLAKDGAPRLDWAKSNWDAGNAVMINDVVYKPTPKTDLNLNTNSNSNISNGAANTNINSPETNKTIADALTVNNTIDSIKTQIGFRDPSAALTADELASIERQAVNAGAEYDPLITKAESAKKQGMPKAIIGAGESGGFMSTQYAGASALAPTEGGTFVGTGGELNRIKSEYDANIDNLNTAKTRAISAARVAAEQAIRTGKSEWNKQAAQLLELAQKANDQAITMAQKKVDLVASYDKIKQARTTYNVSKINDLAIAGTPMDAATKKEVDDLYGEGYAEKYYNIAQGKAEIQDFKDLYDLLKDVPVGKKIPIGGVMVEGLNDGAIKTYQLTNGATNEEVLVTYNPVTNETVVKSLGIIGKSSGNGDGPNALGLTASQLAEAKGQYFAKNPGKTEADFNLLPNEQKITLAMASSSLGPTVDMIKQDALNSKAAGTHSSAAKYILDFNQNYKRSPTPAELAAINEAFASGGSGGPNIVGGAIGVIGNWLSNYLSEMVEE